MRYRELIIGIAIAVVLLLVFVFLEKFFNTVIPIPHESTSQSILAATATQAQPALAYHGRKLDEVRIDPDIAKSLSMQQKTKVSADIRMYAKMAHDTPEYTAAWLQLAILKKSVGDYEGARDIWAYVTLLRPQEIVAFLNLGDLYTNYLKDYRSAEQNLRAAIKVDSKNDMAYIRLSELYIYFYKEKEAQAEVVLKEGIAANPNNANLAHALARLYERAQAK